MKNTYRVKRKVDSAGRIVLPRSIRKMMNIIDGKTVLDIKYKDNTISISKSTNQDIRSEITDILSTSGNNEWKVEEILGLLL